MDLQANPWIVRESILYQSPILNMAYLGGYVLIPFLTAIMTKYLFKLHKVWPIALQSYLTIPIVNLAIYASVPQEMIASSMTQHRGDTLISPSDHTIDIVLFIAMMAVPLTLAIYQVLRSKSPKES